MKYCSTCGNHYYDELSVCPICKSLYEKDVEEGLIPPGISEENYSVNAWQIFKGIMKSAELRGWPDEITLKQVESRMREYEQKHNGKKTSPSGSEQNKQLKELADLGKGFLERLHSGGKST